MDNECLLIDHQYQNIYRSSSYVFRNFRLPPHDVNSRWRTMKHTSTFIRKHLKNKRNIFIKYMSLYTWREKHLPLLDTPTARNYVIFIFDNTWQSSNDSSRYAVPRPSSVKLLDIFQLNLCVVYDGALIAFPCKTYRNAHRMDVFLKYSTSIENIPRYWL